MNAPRTPRIPTRYEEGLSRCASHPARLVYRVRALVMGEHPSPEAGLHEALADAQRGGVHPEEAAELARTAATMNLRLRCGHPLESVRLLGAVGSCCEACRMEMAS